jgi:hypothetical protein
MHVRMITCTDTHSRRRRLWCRSHLGAGDLKAPLPLVPPGGASKSRPERRGSTLLFVMVSCGASAIAPGCQHAGSLKRRQMFWQLCCALRRAVYAVQRAPCSVVR